MNSNRRKTKPRLTNQAEPMTPSELARRHQAMVDQAIVALRDARRRDMEQEINHGETDSDK